MKKLKLEEIKEYIQAQSESSKIYIGCDSRSFQKNGLWYADFYLVVVVHKNGRNGCKIFGEVQTEQVYQNDKKKPRYRLMMEVYKASELFLKLADSIGDRAIEVHLDLNPDKKHISSSVIAEAIGYIKGTCNVVPMVKPDAWAASYAADRIGRSSTFLKAC